MRGIGYEINPILVCLSRLLVFASGIQIRERVRVERLDFFALPGYPRADVVLLYLSDADNERLAPRLECSYSAPPPSRQVRVLSRDFEVPGWTPSAQVQRGRTRLLLYRVPERSASAVEEACARANAASVTA